MPRGSSTLGRQIDSRADLHQRRAYVIGLAAMQILGSAAGSADGSSLWDWVRDR
jgi:hypothetical protein